MRTENGKKLLTLITKEMLNELSKAKQLNAKFQKTSDLTEARALAQEVKTCFDNHKKLQDEIGVLVQMEQLFPLKN